MSSRTAPTPLAAPHITSVALPATMRALVRSRYGGPEVLSCAEVPVPRPGPDEVLIRVGGSSLNYADALLLTGRPRLMRLAFGVLRPRQPVMGIDAAGEVVAVGERVTGVRVGERVYGEGAGCHAQYAVLKADRVARAPSNLDDAEAGTVPVAAVTALQGLRDSGRVGEGSRVLINGASGGVGTWAVQIAAALGASEVTGVCSGRNAALVRGLGADVIDYTREDFTASSRRWDCILDLVGSHPIRRCLGVLSPEGVYVGSSDSLGAVFKTLAMSLVTRRVRALVAKPTIADLDALRELIEAEAIAPVIARRIGLDAIPEAMEIQCARRARGKFAIRVG